MPPHLRSELPKDLENAQEVGELLQTEKLWEMLGEAMSEGLLRLRPFFLSVLFVALSYHAAILLFPQSKEGVAQTALLIGGALVLFRGVEGTVERVVTAIGDLSSFALGTVPLWGGLLAAGGSETAALSASSGLLTFCTVTAHLSASVVVPLARILLLFALLSFANVPMLGELSRTVRGWVLSLLGVFGALLPAALAFQTTLSFAADSMAVRTVKYAVGQSVPVVGGAVSGALGALAGSLVLLKSTLGGASFFALLLLLLPPLAELFLCRTVLSLGGAVANGTGVAPLGRLLGEFKGVCDLLLAVLAAVLLTFLLLLGVLGRVGLAVGGGV